MKKEQKEKFRALSHKIKLDEEEVKAWENAGNKMFVPYDKKLGINPQDDAFLEKEVWDFENTPKEKFPLLLHYHPLQLYRFQVIKQADVVLAMFLLGNEFSKDLKKTEFRILRSIDHRRFLTFREYTGDNGCRTGFRPFHEIFQVCFTYGYR